MKTTRNCVEFILDGKILRLNFAEESAIKPTTTVLNYLRSIHGHKGVKEGCGEGDCGACTIVVAEEGIRGNLEYKALNSCLLFLPMLHGKQLITIENLAQKKGQEILLHPVQQAIVDEYGSQCGYCTPGMVLSMFSLYKNSPHAQEDSIKLALSGNLCRCTGYKSILNAAKIACSKGPEDHFTNGEDAVLELIHSIHKNTDPILLQTDDYQYYIPFTTEDLLHYKSGHPEALIIAGASDIALRQTKKNELLPNLIDISQLNDLKFIQEDHAGFYFGAGISIEELRDFSEDRYPALFNVLNVFGSHQIRHLATLGGNLATASPISDMIPILLVADASIRLISIHGQRELKLEEFIKGYRQTDLKADEIILMVRIPKNERITFINTYKVSRRKDVDISCVNGAFSVELSRNNRIDDIRIGFGGMAAQAKRAAITEAFLSGKQWERNVIEEAMQLLYTEFQPISDARAKAESRSILAGNLLMKFFLDVNYYTKTQADVI